MSNTAGILNGLGQGVLRGLELRQRQEEYEERKQERLADRAVRDDERAQAKKLNLSLADAAKPVSVNDNAMSLDNGTGKPAVYEDAGVANSDYRQQRSMGLADVKAPAQTITAGGKTYDTRPEADAAALAANQPQARAGRLADAYNSNGKPMEALQLQTAASTLRASEMTMADKVFRTKLGQAMQGGHTGLEKLVSESEYGPVAGKKVKAVPSADGKQITYNIVGPDGALTPANGMTFSNDQDGITKAAYLLDQSITPEHRYTNFVSERKASAGLAKDAAVFEETKRHNLAGEANTLGGQLTNDLRARELNATKVEENKLKRESKEESANLTKSSQLASFDTMLGTLGRLATHKGLARSVGAWGAMPTMPGSDSANFQAELNTFQSQAFLPMVAQLKGMGALSDAEGKKLTAAVGALDPKMGETAFRESVDRITTDMNSARGRMAGTVHSGTTAQGGAKAGGTSPKIGNASDYAKLPSGATYIAPDGTTRTKK